MAKEEKEKRENREFLELMAELYIQLSPWDRFQVRLYIKWMKFRRKLRNIVWSWLIFQLELDEKIKSLLKKET